MQESQLVQWERKPSQNVVAFSACCKPKAKRVGPSPSKVPDSLGVQDLAPWGNNGSTLGEVNEGGLHKGKLPEAQLTSKPDAANFQLLYL